MSLVDEPCSRNWSVPLLLMMSCVCATVDSRVLQWETVSSKTISYTFSLYWPSLGSWTLLLGNSRQPYSPETGSQPTFLHITSHIPVELTTRRSRLIATSGVIPHLL
jgi:hypothetical protein